MRVCVVYDCLFPYTIGGAERWYRNLAERLAAEGHEVTYLTLRQWPRRERPTVGGGVQVVAAGPGMALYEASGRRRILPPLVFGLGVLGHLLRHPSRYDVVHTCAFPYFSLLAAARVRARGRYELVVDWFEVWSRSYWRGYLGRVSGRVGALVQRLCARVGQQAFCFSQMHAERLRREGLRGAVTVLRGLYAGPSTPHTPDPAEDLVLFAGRLIPEKRATLGVAAVALATRRIPGLRAEFLGDGPERQALRQAIAEHGLQATAAAPGFLSEADVEERMRRASCLLLPSRREGYGMVVVEAARWGTPSVVVAAEDNAAVELIEEGVNGFVAQSADPDVIADAIVRARAGGLPLREATAAWFARNADSLSLESSVQTVLARYAEASARA
jgi:glycosyltransferase involved in cell wall biosynthesis